MLVDLNELEVAVRAGIDRLGYSGEAAEAILQALMYAEKRGNNQGIVKIATGGVPHASEVEEFRVTKRSKCGVLLSGGHSMYTTQQAVRLSLQLAREHGVGIACSNRTYSSSGAIGYFAKNIAEQGFIGIVCVGNGAFSYVAPTGSHEPRFGTNPLAYAFPLQDGHVVFDNATSAVAFFGLVEAKLNGEKVEFGIGYDKEGKPTDDPAKILEGSMATFAGHKGYGLSLLVQTLGGPFASAGTPGCNEKDGAGTFVMAIEPDLFGNTGDFVRRASELCTNVKSAKPLPGCEVFLPGENGNRKARQIEVSGKIEISSAIWDELNRFIAQ